MSAPLIDVRQAYARGLYVRPLALRKRLQEHLGAAAGGGVRRRWRIGRAAAVLAAVFVQETLAAAWNASVALGQPLPGKQRRGAQSWYLKQRHLRAALEADGDLRTFTRHLVLPAARDAPAPKRSGSSSGKQQDAATKS